jgi:hypothetical protein
MLLDIDISSCVPKASARRMTFSECAFTSSFFRYLFDMLRGLILRVTLTALASVFSAVCFVCITTNYAIRLNRSSFILRYFMVRWGMDEISAPPSAMEKAKNGRPSPYSEEIGAKIIEAVRGGLTLERAAEYVGLNPSTVQGWTERRAEFGRLIKKARREHELSLLRSVEAAGEKSWQARAWCLERIFQYAQPSARLQVSQDVTHGISGNLAQLLAGIAGKKKAQVIDCKDVTPKTLHTIRDNSYCATDATQTITTTTPKVLGKVRHRRMRTRKPRAESLAKYTTTPPLPPPAAV